MKFINADIGYQTDERVVYADGYNKDGSGGKLPHPFSRTLIYGGNQSDQAWKDGRYKSRARFFVPKSSVSVSTSNTS
jgi:hypothetical protein